MAHEIDITDGIASYADARTDAWHQLGQQVGHTMTADEAMEAAHLSGWNVRKMPLTIPQEPVITEYGVTTPEPIAVPDRFATVRTNPINGGIDYLGVVGDRYTPIQNEENAELLNMLADESGAHFETAGALRGGRQTFVTMKLPEAMVFDGPGGRDASEIYIAALNSHDGSSALRLLVTPVRIVCANTQSAALGAAKASWSIRHTAGSRFQIAEARESLRLTFRYVAAFEEQCERMVARSMAEDEVDVFLRELFEVEDAETERRSEIRQDHVRGALGMLRSPANAAIAGTAYGAYNAVTEYVDHGWRTRGAGGRSGVTAESAVFGDGAALKARAFERLITS